MPSTPGGSPRRGENKGNRVKTWAHTLQHGKEAPEISLRTSAGPITAAMTATDKQNLRGSKGWNTKQERKMEIADDAGFWPVIEEGGTTLERARKWTWKFFEEPENSKASFYVNM